MTRAVVFAYHNVGVRCLRVLLAHGIDVPLVVTHADDPAETIWYASVAATAAECGIPAITPDDPNAADVVARVAAAAPEFVFSFYYRKMLRAPLLALGGHGALNMHGSLLPRYRGRAPVNWAVLRACPMEIEESARAELSSACHSTSAALSSSVIGSPQFPTIPTTGFGNAKPWVSVTRHSWPSVLPMTTMSPLISV